MIQFKYEIRVISLLDTVPSENYLYDNNEFIFVISYRSILYRVQYAIAN